MVPVVGVFKTRDEAKASVQELHDIGVKKDHITLLTPQVTQEELESIPTTQGEQPGMFKALGAVVGGALGAGVVETLAATMIPGVGAVVAIGLAGGAILGAITGGAIGDQTEKAVFTALPEEELYVYEDALRQGRSVVIANAEGEVQAHAARGAMERRGAEDIDSARKMWWLGLRDVEKEKYQGAGLNFERDEKYFRAGFEAALLRSNRGKSYGEVRESLLQRYAPTDANEANFNEDALRKGYERGRAYKKDRFEEQTGAPW